MLRGDINTTFVYTWGGVFRVGSWLARAVYRSMVPPIECQFNLYTVESSSQIEGIVENMHIILYKHWRHPPQSYHFSTTTTRQPGTFLYRRLDHLYGNLSTTIGSRPWYRLNGAVDCCTIDIELLFDSSHIKQFI